MRRQALNVFRMKLLGAEVISVETGLSLVGEYLLMLSRLENSERCSQ